MKLSRHVRLLSALLIGLLSPLLAVSQTLPPASVSLQQLNAFSGTIFSGTVLQIGRTNAEGQQPAAVRVRFRVDQAVQGCVAGETITVDEWAELWMRGDRYRKGQRVVLFLYPNSQTGFSSSVAGDVGMYVIGPDGLLRTTPQQASSLVTQATSSQTGARPTHGESDPQIARPRLRSFSEQKKRTLYREVGR